MDISLQTIDQTIRDLLVAIRKMFPLKNQHENTYAGSSSQLKLGIKSKKEFFQNYNLAKLSLEIGKDHKVNL